MAYARRDECSVLWGRFNDWFQRLEKVRAVLQYCSLLVDRAFWMVRLTELTRYLEIIVHWENAPRVGLVAPQM
jgi:hypothetical protein